MVEEIEGWLRLVRFVPVSECFVDLDEASFLTRGFHLDGELVRGSAQPVVGTHLGQECGSIGAVVLPSITSLPDSCEGRLGLQICLASKAEGVVHRASVATLSALQGFVQFQVQLVERPQVGQEFIALRAVGLPMSLGLSESFERRLCAAALLKRAVVDLGHMLGLPLAGLQLSRRVATPSGSRPAHGFSPYRSFDPRSRERSPSRAACTVSLRCWIGPAQLNGRSDPSAWGERRCG